MHTMPQEQSGLPETSFDEDIPLLEGFRHESDKPGILEKVREIIKRRFPKLDFKKLGPIGFSKKSGNETEIVSIGPKGGEYAIFKKGSEDILELFTKKKSRIKDALGPKAEDIIAEVVASIREEKQREAASEKQNRANSSQD